MPDAGADERSSRAPGEPAPTAGSLLKAARESEGLHLAVLAATIKVAPAKLEALEKDRYDELPNLTFARALAQSVCRSLKIDPRPVLALLPQAEAPPLEGAMGSLNTPFQERSSRSEGTGLAWASKPMFLAGGLLLLAAVVVGLLPPDWLDRWRSGGAPRDNAAALAPAVPAASAAASAAEGMAAAAADAASSVAAAAGDAASAVAAAAAATLASASSTGEAAASAPTAGATTAAATTLPADAASAATAPQGLLGLTASAPSWVEVRDADGKPVFERLLRKGESVAVDGKPPLRLRVGNAGGTVVTFRGQPQDLAPYTRNNVARLELR
ncbi:MAG: helix-turn-helix domain-containing protein [Proteobacteria bacterium]|nr:helix-turn-helix domain-containing protein [Pseudomonadota bacterium]